MPSDATSSEPTKSGDLPKSGDGGSESPTPTPRSSSVFDFIYHDARRVGSFLSQFEGHGLPQQIKATESTGHNEATKTAAGAGFDLFTLARGQAAMDITATEDIKDISEKTFDPLWSNARRLLDYLTEHDLIERDIWRSVIGQFVLVSGTLIVLDMGLLKEAWPKPSIKRIMTSGIKDEMKRNKASAEDQKKASEMFFDLLSILPHNIQGHLVGDNFNVWFSIIDSSLVGSASDIMLKNGAWIQGFWQVLGVIDGTPEPPRLKNDDGSLRQSMDELVIEHVRSPIPNSAAVLAPIARDMMGRPRHYFGMTPLLIFRQVSGRVSDLPDAGAQLAQSGDAEATG